MKKINRTLLSYAVLISIILSLAMALQVFAEEQTVQQRIAGEIIRFHVAANSDSDEDQAIKGQVQAALLNKVGRLIADSTGIEETRAIISENMEAIVSYAKAIAGQYTTDQVTGGLYTRSFPAIRYGDLMLPAGDYEALTIRIGTGTGGNWWCVMFPMLCFLTGEPEVTEEMHQILGSVLTEEEYQALFNREVNVRFRTLDLWNERNTVQTGDYAVAIFQ